MYVSAKLVKDEHSKSERRIRIGNCYLKTELIF